ncbi:MAG: hypothetical protein IT260_07960 [Saprospiraceae bacterium]|nr:hypothetical protein [Saprospiraceae bacterium]
MKNTYILVLAMWLSQIGLVLAQTPAENLQAGVEIYNALRTFQDTLSAKTITPENVRAIKTRVDKGVALLDKVISDGSDEEARSARYFKTNLRYQYGFALGMHDENEKAYEVLSALEPEMTALTPASFPFRYVFFDKNFVVKWENFAASQAEYYTGMGEMAYVYKKYGDALRFIRLGLTHPNTTEWLKYIGINKILDIYAKDQALLTQEEYLDAALQSIRYYDLLPEDNKKQVADYEYPTVLRGLRSLSGAAAEKNDARSIARFMEAGATAARYEPKSVVVLKMLALCYSGEPAGDIPFHKIAQAYAQTNFLLDRTLAEKTGVSATDRLAALTPTSDCAGLQEVANLYAHWRRSEPEATFRKKAENCLAEQEKARKKAERASRRANSHFNLYLGANILPLLNTNARRDYGGVLNFVFEHTAFEFSYLKINQNKENIFDLWINEVEGADQDNISRWDGFKAHFQPKFFTKNGKGGYVGILLGYNEKNFEPLTVTATHDTDGAISQQSFDPSVTQYTAMLNLGAMKLFRGFGLDIFFGVGANYSQFDAGNPIDRSAYTIDNPLLEFRKDKYFGVFFRTGITFGLNFGPGND